jgi:CheY-like chemotaxis protein
MALMRALRDDARFADLPIVAVSALAMPGDAARILEAGADRYLPKPVRLAELARTIEELLSTRAG